MADTTTSTQADFYDIVADLQVLSEAGYPFQGYKMDLSDKGYKLLRSIFPDLKEGETVDLTPAQVDELSKKIVELNEASVLVSVVGSFDKGKSFLLGKISGVGLASGHSVTTKGVSVKATQKAVYLDTAGSNAPIPVGLLELAEKEFLLKDDARYKQYLKEKNAPRPENLAEVRKWEADVDAATAELQELRIGRALVNKKSMEIFLSDLIYELSDVKIFVMNEMTWQDQQALIVLKKKMLTSFNETGVKQRLIVVHNFKTTKTEEDYEKLREKYVKSCFHGHEREVEIISPVVNQRETFSYWETAAKDMIHICLAEEGSPAGNVINSRALECLKNLVGATQGRELKYSFLDMLHQKVHLLLEEFYSNIEKVKFTYTNEGERGVLRLCASSLPPTTTEGQATGDKSLRLTRDEVEINGMSLILGGGFQPLFDVLKINDKTVQINIDLPGFVIVPQKPRHYSNSFAITRKTVDGRVALEIKGNRSLYHLKWSETGQLVEECQTYDRNLINARIGRKKGEFKVLAFMPEGFDITGATIQHGLFQGVLQILIKRPQGNDDIFNFGP